MTRTVRDNALMLQVIAGHDPLDPGSADEPVPDFSSGLGQDVKGLRIGVIRHFYTTDVAADPEQIEALDAAIRLFAEAGAETCEITLPPLQDFNACGQIILAAEAYAVHEQWLKAKPHDYGARARERLLAGAELRAVDYLQAVRWRLQLRDQTEAAFADIDVAVTASSMDPACRIDDDVALAANYWRQARMPFNVTGQPGLVIPDRLLEERPTAVIAARRAALYRANAVSGRANSMRMRRAGPNATRTVWQPERRAAYAASNGVKLAGDRSDR
jgi:aspartyl-tRNA(Asn)/glutamyl-tRNA(Gln) amidotransferase subunit A